jgi:cytochrome c oxidase subunit 2
MHELKSEFSGYDTGSFESYLDDTDETNLKYLLTDNLLASPLGKRVKLLITANDVIHSRAAPSSGTKVDAITGRSNAATVKASPSGDFHGQCPELCGSGHGPMPVSVRIRLPTTQTDAGPGTCREDCNLLDK